MICNVVCCDSPLTTAARCPGRVRCQGVSASMSIARRVRQGGKANARNGCFGLLIWATIGTDASPFQIQSRRVALSRTLCVVKISVEFIPRCLLSVDTRASPIQIQSRRVGRTMRPLSGRGHFRRRRPLPLRQRLLERRRGALL